MCLTQVFPREPIEDDLDGYFKDRVMLVLVFFLTTLGFIFPFHIQTAVFFSENLKTGLPSQHRADFSNNVFSSPQDSPPAVTRLHWSYFSNDCFSC